MSLITSIHSSLDLPLGATSYKSGRYYGAPMLRANGTKSVVANTLYAVPVRFSGRGSFSDVGVYCTAGTGVKARFGLYTNVSDLPGALIFESGEKTLTASAQNDATINRIIDAGKYWATIVVDGAATLNSHDSHFQVMNMGVINLNSTAPLISVAHTYGALPASFGAPSYTESSSNITIGFKAA